MARLFSGATDNLTVADGIISGWPMTAGCWFRYSASLGNMFLMSIIDATAVNRFRLEVRGDLSDQLNFSLRDAGGDVNHLPGNATINTWHHAVMRGENATSHSCFLDGGSEAFSATSKTPTGMDTFKFSDISLEWVGDIAEGFVYNVALTDAEVAFLAARNSPLLLTSRLPNLVSHFGLLGSSLNDTMASRALTATGTTVSTHPRILQPFRPRISHISAAAPSSNLPAISNYYRRLRA